MTLLDEIASWDGKSAAALQSTYERHSDDEDFLATILEHIGDVEMQRAATWLLKRHLEVGISLSPGGSRAILDAFSRSGTLGKQVACPPVPSLSGSP